MNHSHLTAYINGYSDGFRRALDLIREETARSARSGEPLGEQPQQAVAPAVAAALPRCPDCGTPILGGKCATLGCPGRGEVRARLGAPRRRRRKLRPAEEYALLAVTENPGLSFGELRSAHGVRSAAPIYSLVARRLVRRVEDPKPHHSNQPRVRFYPTTSPASAEIPNGSA